MTDKGAETLGCFLLAAAVVISVAAIVVAWIVS